MSSRTWPPHAALRSVSVSILRRTPRPGEHRENALARDAARETPRARRRARARAREGGRSPRGRPVTRRGTRRAARRGARRGARERKAASSPTPLSHGGDGGRARPPQTPPSPSPFSPRRSGEGKVESWAGGASDWAGGAGGYMCTRLPRRELASCCAELCITDSERSSGSEIEFVLQKPSSDKRGCTRRKCVRKLCCSGYVVSLLGGCARCGLGISDAPPSQAHDGGLTRVNTRLSLSLSNRGLSSCDRGSGRGGCTRRKWVNA